MYPTTSDGSPTLEIPSELQRRKRQRCARKSDKLLEIRLQFFLVDWIHPWAPLLGRVVFHFFCHPWNTRFYLLILTFHKAIKFSFCRGRLAGYTRTLWDRSPSRPVIRKSCVNQVPSARFGDNFRDTTAGVLSITRIAPRSITYRLSQQRLARELWLAHAP